MRKTNRSAMLFLGALLLAAPGVGRAADVDRLLPADAEMVVCVNVAQFLESPLAQKYALEPIKAGLKSSAEAQVFLGVLGLDPFKDIRSVTFARPLSRGEDKGLVIVRGSFNLPKIHAAADAFIQKQPDALKFATKDSLRIYERREKGAANPIFACFLDKGTLVLSPAKSYVEDAITQNGGGKPAPIAQGLSDLVGTMDAKQTFWLAALLTSKELNQELADNPQTKNLAEKLKHVGGGITVSDGFRADFHVQTEDAGAAVEVRKLLEGVKGILALVVLNHEEYGPVLADIVGALKVSADQGRVTLEGKVSGEDIAKGLRKVQK